MRNPLFSSLTLTAAVCLLVGSMARAGSLTAATWSSTTQGIHLTATASGATCTDTLTTHVQQSILCPTAGLNPSGSATATSYSVSLTMPLFSVKQFTTGGAIDLYTRVALSGRAAITGSGSMAAGTGVPGAVTVKVAAHAAKCMNPSMLSAQRTTLVKVPLSVGKAGTLTGYFYVLTNIHYITVDLYAWTPHTKTFTGLTSKYQALPTPTVVAMGSFALTAGGGGTVALVSPSMISINGILAQRRTASFTTLKLSYQGAVAPAVPEPGTLLLLGAGMAGLLRAGSRKRS